MKTANFLLQPGIEVVIESSVIVGISAVFLQRAGVTGVCFGAILCDALLRVERPKLKKLADWALL
jgi:hypothetical protein